MGIPGEIKALNTIEQCKAYYNRHEAERDRRKKRYDHLKKVIEDAQAELDTMADVVYGVSNKSYILARIGEIASGIGFD